MPEIPKAQYLAYCDLAAFDAAILSAIAPEAAIELRLGPRCDEEVARRTVAAVLGRLDVRKADLGAAQQWASQRPRGDAAAIAAWERAQPPGLRGPAEWAAMSAAEREAWKARVRVWVGTSPRMPPPASFWSRAGSWIGWHTTELAAIGAGFLVVVIAAVVAVRGRAPRRLPSAEDELE
jgi:hypothetical protein